MRFAYADPPYPGQAARHHSQHGDYGGEVDHGELIGRLERDVPDGWALSRSASALQEILPLCPAPEWSRPRRNRWPQRKQGSGVRVLA